MMQKEEGRERRARRGRVKKRVRSGLSRLATSGGRKHVTCCQGLVFGRLHGGPVIPVSLRALAHSNHFMREKCLCNKYEYKNWGTQQSVQVSWKSMVRPQHRDHATERADQLSPQHRAAIPACRLSRRPLPVPPEAAFHPGQYE
jgi:hypothetical protein